MLLSFNPNKICTQSIACQIPTPPIFGNQFIRRVRKHRMISLQDESSIQVSDHSDDESDSIHDYSQMHCNSISRFENRMKNVNLVHCANCQRVSLCLLMKNNDTCQQCHRSNIDLITNSMLPIWKDINGEIMYHVPQVLIDLTLAEKMLLQLVSPFVPQQYINNGTFGIKGHVCCFPQDIGEVATVLPRLPSNIKMIKLVRQVTSAVCGPKTDRTFHVRRYETLRALLWLKRYNVLYKDVTIDSNNFCWMEHKHGATQNFYRL